MSLELAVSIIKMIAFLFDAYFYLIFAYILMSWFPGARESSIGQWIGRLVEPYLELFRRVIPPLGMFDLSPIVAIFVLKLLENGVVQILARFVLPLVVRG